MPFTFSDSMYVNPNHCRQKTWHWTVMFIALFALWKALKNCFPRVKSIITILKWIPFLDKIIYLAILERGSRCFKLIQVISTISKIALSSLRMHRFLTFLVERKYKTHHAALLNLPHQHWRKTNAYTGKRSRHPSVKKGFIKVWIVHEIWLIHWP